MEIKFKTKELEKCAQNPGYAKKKLGKTRANLFFRRLQILYSATCFEDLRHVPGHFHELNYSRKGQWGFDLDQPYRLIVTPKTLPIAVDNDGKYIWSFIQDAIVVEIINYHKEK